MYWSGGARPCSARRVGEVETRVSAKHLCAGSIPARASMSAEHGGHGEVTITNIIVSVFMAILLIPQVHEKLEELTEAVVLGGNAGGHH